MGGSHALVIKAELARLEEVRQFVESSAKSLQADERTISDLRLAVVEAVTNIIIHGYKNREGTIKISVDRNAVAVIVCLLDRAPIFDPSLYVTPGPGVSPEQKTPGGFGIRLIKQVMDEVSYRVSATGGNELTLIKHTG